MPSLHAPASVFPFQTPAGLGSVRTLPNAPHEHLDADAFTEELNAWHDDTHAEPTGDELEAMLASTWDASRAAWPSTDDTDPTPPAGCVSLPRVWSDDTLIGILDSADQGDPHGYLRTLGIRGDSLSRLTAACAAELVVRLDGRALALAA